MLKKITIATRKSPLALWQAEYVASLLKSKNHGIEISFKKIVTDGDKIIDKPLYEVGGKGLFLKQLEEALLSKEADIAVHSMKDIPAQLHSELTISAILRREDARDVFVSNKMSSINEIQPGNKIGSSSIRRICLLNDFCQNIKISELRGNIHTRLEKLEQKNMDGIILAAAGLKRLKLESKIKEYLDYTKWIPAIGQGAIGIEMKKDSSIKSYIENLNHKETSICINTERIISKFFNASCETPLGAYAHLENKNIKIFGMAANPQTKILKKESIEGELKNSKELSIRLAEKLATIL
tara:strand:- start:119 stop:1009 length:891 start_codon:yes stop_codon:yes gene_type:complete